MMLFRGLCTSSVTRSLSLSLPLALSVVLTFTGLLFVSVASAQGWSGAPYPSQGGGYSTPSQRWGAPPTQGDFDEEEYEDDERYVPNEHRDYNYEPAPDYAPRYRPQRRPPPRPMLPPPPPPKPACREISEEMPIRILLEPDPRTVRASGEKVKAVVPTRVGPVIVDIQGGGIKDMDGDTFFEPAIKRRGGGYLRLNLNRLGCLPVKVTLALKHYQWTEKGSTEPLGPPVPATVHVNRYGQVAFNAWNKRPVVLVENRKLNHAGGRGAEFVIEDPAGIFFLFVNGELVGINELVIDD